MSIKILVVFTETGTGEQESFIAEVNEISSDSIIGCLNVFLAEDPYELEIKSFIKCGTLHAAIATCHDNYFGDMIWQITVYTEFLVNNLQRRLFSAV